VNCSGRSEKPKVQQQRVENAVQCLTSEVFRQCVRGLYEVDRVTFTLMLALNVDVLAHNITRHEFVTFVKCALPTSIQLKTIFL